MHPCQYTFWVGLTGLCRSQVFTVVLGFSPAVALQGEEDCRKVMYRADENFLSLLASRASRTQKSLARNFFY